LFSPRPWWNQLPAHATQTQLRQLFERWGLPDGFRCDNGWPWGSSNDLPTGLACWLVGLGIRMFFNPPCRPQDNGVIERSQGTGKRWAEPNQCHSAAELQARLDHVDRLQREAYPHVEGRSRWETYPELACVRRRYRAAGEKRCWNIQAVWDYLAQQVFPRRVDKQGKVSVYNRPQRVGQAWAGQEVWLTVDAETVEWVYLDAEHREVCRRPLRDWTAESLCDLSDESGKPPKRRRRHGKTSRRD
jgi:hypothetical protein